MRHNTWSFRILYIVQESRYTFRNLWMLLWNYIVVIGHSPSWKVWHCMHMNPHSMAKVIFFLSSYATQTWWCLDNTSINEKVSFHECKIHSTHKNWPKVKYILDFLSWMTIGLIQSDSSTNQIRTRFFLSWMTIGLIQSDSSTRNIDVIVSILFISSFTFPFS